MSGRRGRGGEGEKGRREMNEGLGECSLESVCISGRVCEGDVEGSRGEGGVRSV